MAKFRCKKCDTQKEISKHTMKIVNGEVVSPEAMCCEEYMDSIRDSNGLGGIIKRPGGRIRGRR